MDKACPLCNGIQQVNGQCPRCQRPWQDGGAVDVFLGPYSPYETQLVYTTEQEDSCVHLLYCPHCGIDKRVEIPKLEL